MLRLFLFSIALMTPAWGAQAFRAGMARMDITPARAIWMSGYANRNKPSEGVAQKLWAKALVMEEKRVKTVIVSSDLIGLPRAVSDVVAARVAKAYGIDRAHLLLNSAHTHSGPAVRPNLDTMYFDIKNADRQVLDEYALQLVENLVTVVGAAIADLAPARMAIGHGTAGLGANRRVLSPTGVRFGVHKPGPVDHDVPVISVRSPEGKLRGVMFAYACHNTTLGGDFYQIHGDYAGYAQAEVESRHPGATAMFLLLCGADQNPEPRNKLENAVAHGKELGAAVEKVLDGGMKPFVPSLKAAWQTIDLKFASHSRETFEKEKLSKNKFEAFRARTMLKAYDEGRPVRRVPYPVQAIRLSKNIAMVALGGEVVVDYALRAKKEFAGTDLIVAGYSNEVMCYIASKRILKEGGYEAVASMVYYNQPGPLSEEVEDDIFASIHKVLTRVGVKAGKR
ncbi:MAG: neutral/alkaline non-lysosomal ceramidase N-terminal domain-containing protein [Candidatus Solibacter usitatus]|nr:neutral/alkaline non-lysosomal ceramidase N-terminal domain-containing protein [Candidatus Solibacter usitatus]